MSLILLRPLILALILVFTAPVYASPEVGNTVINKQQAVSIAQQVFPGRVLAVKRKDSVYRVKTLSDDGEVRIILVDATTGKVISEQ